VCARTHSTPSPDRDFAVEFTGCAALLMTHLSRFCEELVLWMSPRFGFIDLADRFCTGSSIMPQKKNPDVAELIRGKTGRASVTSSRCSRLMKGLPLALQQGQSGRQGALFERSTRS